jgi:hypothetical protein
MLTRGTCLVVLVLEVSVFMVAPLPRDVSF